MCMKFVLLSFLFCLFGGFVLAETPLNNKSWGIMHIEHLDHIPHHPTSKDPTDQGGHDGIIYPRKKMKKWVWEFA
jgi:hypothetical protein